MNLTDINDEIAKIDSDILLVRSSIKEHSRNHNFKEVRNYFRRLRRLYSIKLEREAKLIEMRRQRSMMK